VSSRRRRRFPTGVPRTGTRSAIGAPTAASGRPAGQATGIGLEVLSADAIRRSIAAAKEFGELIFGLNVSSWTRQIAGVREDILKSLVTASLGPFSFQRWQRILGYRYSNSPLSCAGSVKGMAGGRFNYGSFDRLNFQPFPALYLAENRDTAWSERYGQMLETPNALTHEELALTRRESVTYVSVSGKIERVVDLRDPTRLQSFAAIVSGFKVPPDLLARARKLKMRPLPRFPRDVHELTERLLEKEWRKFPMGFDMPSPSQQFGQLVLAAGIGGVLFPSTRGKGGALCLALFPANFAGGDSEVVVDDVAPAAATHTGLSAATYRAFLHVDGDDDS
jgi:hypothetical protein